MRWRWWDDRRQRDRRARTRALLDRIGIHPSIEDRVIAIILHRDAGTLRRLIARAEAWDLVDNANDMTNADVSRAIQQGKRLIDQVDMENT